MERPSMNYKVIYHVGDAVGLTTRGTVGRLSLSGGWFVITGKPEVSIPRESLRSVELLRMHGTGRMLKIVHADGTLFVSVIRFCLFGYFAVVNFLATGKLHKELEEMIRPTGVA
jgi:hypothetical protein